MSEEKESSKLTLKSEQAQNKSASTQAATIRKEDGCASRPDTTDTLDDSWAELSQDWQSQPYQKVDVQALLVQTKKRTFWAKFLLSLNVLATIAFIVAVGVMWMNDSKDTATMIYLVFGSVGSIVFVYFEIKIRLTAWRQVAASPEHAIDNAIKGIESSISYIRLTKFSCYFLVPVGCWYLVEMAQQDGKSIWGGLLIMNSIIAVMWIITHYFHCKRNAELKQLKLVKAV